VQDQLFATLDTRTRKWTVESGVEVLLSDTVGFVSKLPHHLVASFKATLEEAVNADLLLHVVDASSSEVFDQIKSVETVLKEIGCGEKEMLVVLNKSDRIANRELFDAVQTVYPTAISISARTGYQLDQVAHTIAEKVRGAKVRIRVVSGAADGKLHHLLHTVGEDLTEQYHDNSVTMELTLGRNQLSQLERFSPGSVELV
jgi:GTP-binding protein HflX